MKKMLLAHETPFPPSTQIPLKISIFLTFPLEILWPYYRFPQANARYQALRSRGNQLQGNCKCTCVPERKKVARVNIARFGTCARVLSGQQDRMSRSFRKTSNEAWVRFFRQWEETKRKPATWYPQGMSSSSGESVSNHFFHSFSAPTTAERISRNVFCLLSSTRFNHTTSNIHLNGFGWGIS